MKEMAPFLTAMVMLWVITNGLGGIGGLGVLIWYRSRYSTRGGRTN